MAFLLSRRGLTLATIAVVLTVACVLLGLWQMDRYELRQDRNSAVTTALDAPSVPLSDVLPAGGPLPDGAEWRTVVVEGRYDPSAQVTLRLRPVDGQAGLQVLTPLVQPDGTAVLVDRGFLPTQQAGQQVDVPEPASGTVEVTGRLRLSETGRGSGIDVDSQPPSIRFVDLESLDGELGLDLAPVWVERLTQTPPDPGEIAPIPAPTLSAGPSLIYSIQWFLFGVIAVVGFVVLARRDSRSGTADTDEVPDPAAPTSA